jgi:hypothetical protein
MTEKKKDDLETVRILTEALESFSEEERERIIRWSREKLGMSTGQVLPTHTAPQTVTPKEIEQKVETAGGYITSDIKSFVEKKAPKNDSQFCAVVAYFYQFEAPENHKKESIGGDDLQDAARKVNRDRFTKPAQTLINAFNSGYLDKAEHGKYRINTVGENLVAMVLPGGGEENGGSRKSNLRKKSKKAKGTKK